MDEAPRVYRYRRVAISVRFLQDLITQGRRSDECVLGSRCVEGLPPDARHIQSYVDWEGTSARLVMVFEHPDWPPVPEGAAVPWFVPEFEQYARDPLPG